MIISRGRRYIFVHIPKTGGTAMAMALEGRAMKDDVLIGDTPKAQRRKARLKHLQTTGRLWKHSTLSDIDGIVQAHELKELYNFTLVRNPWDRLVSYYHWLQGQTFDHQAVKLAQQLDFSAFLNASPIRHSLRAQPYRQYMTASDGIEYCNAYVRLEHLEQDLASVWTHLGFKLDIPVANTSERRRDYRFYYSNEDTDLVARICSRDIAQFGYQF
ncbi:sulfotransferase family 2 domain-containing protein [Roseovarius sp. EL26]|uniref:sulfotransferase family 2 domain-containing protein n=1 Tax=Roseovarius sp. EL26 TaxID=2126672 RepID=UPI000EA2849F|nr:sulfotransferase family 2 domain-containing protein [Roseovarius sp. EL26]